MSMVFYDAGNLTIGVDSQQVAERLGNLAAKTPAVIKVSANYTARETRKEMQPVKRWTLRQEVTCQ